MERKGQLSDDTHCVDRLSALPDAVICHILSFIPTYLSVKTSILARRWRFLWAHVPVLDFDSGYHRFDSNIVNRVMLLHKVQSLNTFRLNVSDIECNDDDLKAWIDNVVWRNVQILAIYLNHRFAFMVPQFLFTCKTLVSLSFRFCVLPTFSGAVLLPSLKNLSLLNVEYVVEENLPHLLSGCPMLEELTICRIWDPDMGFLNIFSPTIKRLSIYSPFSCHENEDPIHGIKINAPALRYLRVCYCPSNGILFMQPVTFLSEAYLDLNPCTVEKDFRFLDNFSNVKCLNLSYMKNLDLAVAGALAKFHNLTKLTLVSDWRLLSYFLEFAANLQVLIINKVHSDIQCWMEPPRVPKCLLSHLRTVKIDLLWPEHCFELIRYLLKNAKVLEKMEIRYQYLYFPKAKLDVLKRIASFKRGSEECELVFH